MTVVIHWSVSVFYLHDFGNLLAIHSPAIIKYGDRKGNDSFSFRDLCLGSMTLKR